MIRTSYACFSFSFSDFLTSFIPNLCQPYSGQDKNLSLTINHLSLKNAIFAKKYFIVGMRTYLIISILLFLPFSFVIAQTQDSTDIDQNITIPDTNIIINNTDNVVFEDDNMIFTADNVIVDTAAKKTKNHSPKVAAWMSTALPGLGQAYNKKYWKMPIIYVGFGGIGVGIAYFAVNYATYRDEYRYRLNNNGARLKMVDIETVNLNAYKQQYQRNMELLIILSAVGYLFNILDAVVDAHLMGFNVSDDLSLNIMPSIGLNNNPLASANKSINITFTLNFK